MALGTSSLSMPSSAARSSRLLLVKPVRRRAVREKAMRQSSWSLSISSMSFRTRAFATSRRDFPPASSSAAMDAEQSIRIGSRTIRDGRPRQNGCIAARITSSSRRSWRSSSRLRLNRWKGEFTRWSLSTWRHRNSDGTLSRGRRSFRK